MDKNLSEKNGIQASADLRMASICSRETPSA
jgi:hypothetical protein